MALTAPRTEPPPAPPRRARHRLALVLAVLAAVLLHAAAWCWLSAPQVGRGAGGRGDTPPPWHTRQLPPPEHSAPAQQAKPNASPQPLAPRGLAQPPAERLAATPTPPSADQTGAPQAGQYLDANQVDRPPAPLSDWVLDEHLPWPSELPVVELRLWISVSGRIDRVDLQGAAADHPGVRALFARLAQTPMEPALLGPNPVASMMRIQLWSGAAESGLLPETPAPPATPGSATR